MSTEKRPLSLRGSDRRDHSLRGVVAQHRREASAGTAVGVIAACLAGVTVDTALAQSTGQQLPSLTVEAPAEVKKKPKPRPARRRGDAAQTNAPAATAPATPATAATATQAAPNANPYADPAAPYKVDRSANTKLTQPLLDTPRTVVAVPKEVMQDKVATSFKELMRTMPGVTLGTGEGGNAYGDRFIIRGYDTRNDTYIDGVRDPGVAVRETFATEQLEILKGPAGTIAGRGTSGGAVNIVTKQASFDKNFAELTSTLGTDKTTRFTTDVNRILSQDFAVRFNGMWQEADVAGRDYVWDNRWGGLLAATWRASDRFKLSADYYHVYLDQLPDWGVPFDRRIARPFTESGVNRNNFYGVPARDFLYNTQDITTLKAEFDITEQVKLTSKLRYGATIMDYVASAPESTNLTNANPDLWTVTSSAKSRYQTNQIASNQNDLTWKFDTGFLKHTLVFGTELSRESVERDTYTGLATESFGVVNTGVTFNLWYPNSGALTYSGPPTLVGRPTDIVVDTKAIYALDTVNYFDRLYVTGGARIDDYTINASSGSVGTLTRHDTMFNWNGGVTYKPLPYGSIYIAYGTSTTPMGAELDAGASDYGGLTAANAVLGPEKNDSAEVGTKWELFNRHLLLTLAVFQNEKTNAREQQNNNLVTATGAYRIRGIELGVSGNVTEKWSMFGGVVFMDSEVTESYNPANIGLHLANIAHQSFSLMNKYQLTEKLAVGGTATFKSEMRGGTFAANNNILPSSWRFDALAEYKVNTWLTAKVNVNNIFNETIYDAFYRSATPFVYVAPGRVAYLTLTARY